MFSPYHGVLFDEIGDAHSDAEFAVLIEVALRVAGKRRFPIAIASATLDASLLKRFEGAPHFICDVRWHAPDMYLVTVAEEVCLWQALLSFTKQLLEDRTSLLFCRGRRNLLG